MSSSKSRLLIVGAAVIGFVISVPAMAADCAKDYKDFWANFDSSRYAKMSAEQIADLSRTALRGYDACSAGDERFTAESFFRKLDSEAYSKSSDIFKSDAFGPNYAK